MKLYPLKFQPLYKYRIWGGNKLKTVLNKKYDREKIGESWEISDVEGDETMVSNGDLSGQTLRALIRKYKGELVGNKTYQRFGNNFPLLIKFIDADLPLSIQVHPDDELAKQRHNCYGKNEMWYVMEADKSAELIIGFSQEIDKDAFKKRLDESTILDVLNVEEVEKGDTFYIPTGRVHAIGAGVLLAEIQQTSDITYRIYDYDRVDAKTGTTRELHNDLTLDVIDFNVYVSYKTKYEVKENKSTKLVHSPYFTTNIFSVNGNLDKDYTDLDSFVIYICVEGSMEIIFNSKKYNLKKGETILLPACIDKVGIKSNAAKVLEVSM